MKRLDFIDLAKGIGMLMVVYLHVSINYPPSLNIYAGSHWDGFVHTMFMPIFFIISGLFLSINSDWKEYLRKKTKRLFAPFFLFYILTYIINVVLVTFFHVNLKSGFSYGDILAVFYKDVFPNSAIWFLLALYWSSLIIYTIIRLTDSVLKQIGLVIISFIIGVVLDKSNINIPLYVDTAFTATIFVYTGYLAKHYRCIDLLNGMRKKNRRY